MHTTNIPEKDIMYTCDDNATDQFEESECA